MTPLDPSQVSRQVEGLRLANLDGKVPVPCHLVKTTQ